MTSIKTLLVSGATGRQGGALIDALLAASAPFRIFALTRKPFSRAAQSLAARSSSITLVQGDLDDPEAVFSSCGLPIWGVYSVQLGVDPSMTPAREVAQGIGLIDAASRHGVKRFVYSSVELGDPPQPTPVPQFQSKYKIEQHLFASTLSWTILRPVSFFENLTPDIVGQTYAGALKYYINPNRSLQFIATADIGWFAAQAFLHPDRYQKKAIRLAAEDMTFAQNAAIFKHVTGKLIPLPWGWWFLPWLVFQIILKDLGTMFRHFSDEGFDVDIDQVKKSHPDLMSYQQWLEKSAFQTV